MLPFYPPDKTETMDAAACELCGGERDAKEMIVVEGHCLCPGCAQLVRTDQVHLTPGLCPKFRSFGFVLRLVRDRALLIGFIHSFTQPSALRMWVRFPTLTGWIAIDLNEWFKE